VRDDSPAPPSDKRTTFEPGRAERWAATKLMTSLDRMSAGCFVDQAKKTFRS